jgi:hypothetical protein
MKASLKLKINCEKIDAEVGSSWPIGGFAGGTYNVKDGSLTLIAGAAGRPTSATQWTSASSVRTDLWAAARVRAPRAIPLTRSRGLRLRTS